MNISSTPFIRNDYWPDQNDINELNKRIDEAENETSLVNSRLSNDIENVYANLNSYVNNQANTIITNNIIVNNLNANYAAGKFANFTNTFTNNAYVENLTVNKPVFDITLNTPHIENATSLGGNIFNVNITDVNLFNVNVDFSNHSGNFNNLHINTANIGNLFVNTEPEPVESSAVLGYDRQGRVIPVHATYAIYLPEDANYLYTDTYGNAFAGTAATSVGETNNLITSFAVKNAIDIVNESFNSVNNALNDIDSWQNTFENSIANSFNDVNNTFNSVNSSIANSFNDVNNTFNSVNSSIANSFNSVNNTFNSVNSSIANSFNSVNNTFNSVNSFIANSFNSVNNTFNSVNSTFNAVNNTFNAVNNTAADATTLVGSVSSALVGNAIPYTSTSLVDYRNVEHIEFVTPADEGYVSEMTVTLSTQAFYYKGEYYQVANSTTGIIQFRGDPSGNFQPINTEVLIKKQTINGRGVIVWGGSIAYTPSISGDNLILTDANNNTIILPLDGSQLQVSRVYTSISTNISVENTIVPVFINFNSSTNTLTYSSNIAITNNYSRIYNIDMRSTFNGCTKFNQPINIPSNTICIADIFIGCTSFNQPVNIPNSVTDISYMLSGCTSFNRPISIPNSVSSTVSMLSGCTKFNQPINIPNSVSSTADMLSGCTKFNQPINIPNSVSSMAGMLYGCTSFNQNDIYIHTTSNAIFFIYHAFSYVNRIGNIHIPTSVPKDTSNVMYNALVNGWAGYTFTAANIKNDL